MNSQHPSSSVVRHTGRIDRRPQSFSRVVAVAAAGLVVIPAFAAGAQTQPAPAVSAAPVAPPSSAAKPAVEAAKPATEATKAAAEAAKAAAEAAARRKAEVDAAKSRCAAVLSKLDVIVIYKESIDDPGECGTLAPVELVAVGKNPQVALSPPAILNCDMAAAVHDWVKSDVQPLARKLLGQPVARLETMSSYSCRNAFGRKGGKLSEHGKANALDIRGFVTAKGDTSYVLENWGLTGVEIAAIAAKAEQDRKVREIAEAKAKAEAAAKLAQHDKAGAQTGGATPGSSSSGDALAGARTLVEGLPQPGIAIGGTSFGASHARPTDLGIVGPSRLGGPKPPPAQKPAYAAAPAPPPVAPGLTGDAQKLAEAKSSFLREVHTTACKRFMTTLGPEADKYHRNHFHIDLAERRTGKQICE